MARTLLVLALMVTSGCVGGRLGHRWDGDGASGVYGGPYVRAFDLDQVADAGTHFLLAGGEASAMFGGERHALMLAPELFLAGDPDMAAGLGLLAAVGFEVGSTPGAHLALCATNYNFVTAGICGRWAPGRWAGVDAELGTALPLVFACEGGC
jgi:hypothetical protein